MTLTHVHGLSYSVDGKRLMIPSHHGLAVHSGGNWSKAPGAQHDYMGFSATSKHWNSNAVYVWNPAPSSRLREAGMHSTLNDGFAWKRSAAAGLKGEPRSVAVHPDNAAIVAVATSAGVFISSDSGDRFRPVEIGKEGFSVFFDLAYIAQNPAARTGYAIATFQRNVYLSKDAGRKWTPIAERGQGR